MNSTDRAHEFVSSWFDRPESGRDVTTLTYLLARVIANAEKAATLAERERIADKLAALTRP